MIAFFGNYSFNDHKRGVENVIDFQAKAYSSRHYYYVHWGNVTKVYKRKHFICLSIKNCWYWPVLLNILLFKIRRSNKITIHSHNALFSIFSLIRTDVLTVHDGLYYHSTQKRNKLNGVLWVLENLLYFKCSKVHFISNFTKNQSLFGKRLNYCIIPNSSHFEELVVKQPEMSGFGSNYILIVRSIEERARFDLLLEVARALPDRNFVVAGKGPLLDYYRNQIKKGSIRNVTMLGYVDDNTLINLYSKCELVLNIAEYGEGFGLPIIEGYLFNKPVIASNKCAIPEVIISEDYLFENTAESITSKILQMRDIERLDYRSFYDSRYSNKIISLEVRKLFKV